MKITLTLELLAASLLLLACGTDSSKPGGGRVTASHAEPVHIGGSISDLNTSDPIADAVIEIQIGNDVFVAHSDASGQFGFSINVDEKDLPAWTAASIYVDDDSYLPESFFYANLEPGTDPANVGVQLKAATVADIVLRRSLTHLGDDAYSGSINSQLQAPTSGTSLAVEFDLSAERLGEGGWMTVNMELRGTQCVGAAGNLTYVSKVGEVPADGDPRLLSLGTSNPDGSFASTAFTWDLSAYLAGDRMEFVVLASDGCNNIGNWDDFEFVEVVGRFHG